MAHPEPKEPTRHEVEALETILEAIDGMPFQSAMDTILTVVSRVYGQAISESGTGDVEKIISELVDEIGPQMKRTILLEVYASAKKSAG